VIRQIKSDPQWASLPMMLITNYLEHQDAAVAAGAVRGFGKGDLGADETLAQLRHYLEPIRETPGPLGH
jgi:hypothetical protein